MLARVLASLLCLAGAVAIALGVASATAWRGSDTLVATAEAADGSTLIFTDPGVLDMAADRVTVDAIGFPADQVILAVGRTQDVEAWVGTDAHTRVTGLESWSVLAVEDVAGTEVGPGEQPGGAEQPDEAEPSDAAEQPDGTEQPDGAEQSDETESSDGAEQPDAAEQPGDAGAATAPDPAGSDLWVAQASGPHRAELDWSRPDGRWSILAATVGPDAAPPILTLTWPREVTTPWLWPGVVGGAVLLLAGAGWWVLLVLTARRSATAAATHGGRGRRSAPSPGVPVPTVPVPAAPEPVVSETIRSEKPVQDQPLPVEPVHGVPAPEPPVPAGSPATAEVGPDGRPLDAPLTRRQIREMEQQRKGRAPARLTWAPAWRASTVSSPRGGHAAATSSPAQTPAAGEASGAPEAPRRGERLAEHVPHLGRRSRHAAQEPAADAPEASPTPTAPTPPGPPVAPGASPSSPAGPAGPRGTSTPTVPAHPFGNRVTFLPDGEIGQSPTAASADAWRRAWGFAAETHADEASPAGERESGEQGAGEDGGER